MATILPTTLDGDVPDSERLVFRLLSEDPAADGWVVLCRTGTNPAFSPGRRRLRPREVDFLVLIPDLAIVCLEVKGGGFEIRDGEWYRPGPPSERTESPIDQAKAAMFQLQNELVAQFRRQLDGAILPIGYAVTLTDVTGGDIRDLDPDSGVIILPDLQRQSEQTLAERLFDIASGIRREAQGGQRLSCDPQIVQEISKYLKPDADLIITPRPVPYGKIEERIVTLTQEQYGALEIIGHNRQCLFEGVAGTGKTMLAIEVAKRRSAAGDRVALVCYNRILGDYLYADSLKRFKLGDLAGSFWHHFAYTLIQHDPDTYHSFANAMDNAVDNDERFNNIVPENLKSVLLKFNAPMFDYLVVDELQDICQDDPYLEILDLVLDGGLKNGRWAMFGDPNQHTNERNPNADLANLHKYSTEYATYELTVNCRNTQPIVRDSNRVIDPNYMGTHLVPIRGPNPTYRYWSDDAELRSLLEDEIRDCITGMNERPGEITVLSTNADSTGRNLLNHAGRDLLGRVYGGRPLLNCPGIYWPATPRCSDREPFPCCQDAQATDDCLEFRTVRRFKGMESKVVILIVDQILNENDRRMLYIGITRARVKLIVLAHTSTREYIEWLRCSDVQT